MYKLSTIADLQKMGNELAGNRQNTKKTIILCGDTGCLASRC